MAVWTVWENPRLGDAAAVKARFVKDSFSWLAFLFPPLWLLANRMIVVFVLLGLAVAGIGLLVDRGDLPPPLAAAAMPVLMFWFGFEARALKRWALARRGWTMTGVVEARRLCNAERRYFSQRDTPAAKPHPSPLPPVPSVPGVLGVPR